MNINDLKFLPQKINNIQNSNQQRCYLSNSTPDSFERTTSTLSFKGGKVAQTTVKSITESAKEILNNKLPEFGAFTAAAFAGLVALATGKRDETTQVAESLINAFNKVEGNDILPEEVINDIGDEEIRVINPEYKEIAETSEENTQTTKVDENINFVKVGFPKKHGRFSQEQIELKNLVENYELPAETASKLFELCEVVVKSKENTLEKYGFDVQFLTKQLPLYSETLEDCEGFINKLYEQYKFPSVGEEVKTPQAEISVVGAPLESEEIYIPDGEKEVRIGSKVVGNIDVSDYKSQKQRIAEKVALAEAKAREKAVTASTAETVRSAAENPVEKPKRTRFVKANPKEDFVNTTLDAVDKNREILYFKIPGTLEPNVKNNLTRLLLRFEDYVSKGGTVRTKWMHRNPVSEKVLADDIKHEIRFRQGGDCPYKNISVEDADELADLINNDSRFRDLFTLHSALRLIDRFVNFNSDVPLEDQCHYAITKIYNALQKAMSNGVDIEVFEDYKHNAFAARMVIEPDKIANPDAFDIAGSYPIKITICENQDDPSNYQFGRKLPIISTIFTKGL